MPSTLSPVLADRFTRIIALLCEIVAEHGVRQLHNGSLTILIYNRIRHIAQGFLARATVPPRRGATTPRPPRAPAAPAPAGGPPRIGTPRVGTPPMGTAVPPRAEPDGPPPRLPRGRAWLLKLMHPTAGARTLLLELLCEPEVAALLVARPDLARLLRPLCHALSVPPVACPAAPPRRRPPPVSDPAGTDPTGTDPTGTDPAGTSPPDAAAPPPHARPARKFPFRRKEDLLFRLRMGTPLPEF